MSNLSKTGTDGKIFWEKYVKNNPRYKQGIFKIAEGKPTPLFIGDGMSLKATIKTYKPGEKLSILQSKIFMFGDKKMAAVKMSGRKGFLPLSRIKNPTSGNGTQYEDEVVDLINAAIVTNGPLNIKIKGGSKVYTDILYAVKVNKKIKQSVGIKSDPKADIILCKDIKNPLAPGSIYISHKKAGGAEAFQQYSGISDTAGDTISKNLNVKKFLSIVASNLEDDDRLFAPIIGNFKDTKLVNYAIYGSGWGGAYSLNHVHLIGQGKPQLTLSSNKKYFVLDFSSHMSLSGDLSIFKGPYIPVFGATYRASRSFICKGITYANTRVGIYPYKKVFSTNNKTLFYDI